MIQINNLSPYEVEMLDHMWTLETEEEFLSGIIYWMRKTRNLQTICKR